MKRKEIILENIRLGKLVHGGQALAETPAGKKLFVWGGLPGELVHVRVLKKKKTFLEGIVTEIVQASADRIVPLEPQSYVSTSPWQIMDSSAEVSAKDGILKETFEREKLNIQWSDFFSADQVVGYRNKMEFGFWGDDEGLHLAHFVRGTHGKQPVKGSVLALDAINRAAEALRRELDRCGIWAGELKSLIVRCSEEGEVVAALFVKKELEELTQVSCPAILKGLTICYSDPQSPASIVSKELYTYGDITLQDHINGRYITYDVLSFFQVNLPVFTVALRDIARHVRGEPTIDLYSGVGTIGVPLNSDILVETDERNVRMARSNIGQLPIQIIHAASEHALAVIDAEHTLIVDPPRAGLHQTVIDRILEVQPKKIVYLSCNPSTQARDIALLRDRYEVVLAQGYNFFPRTPHIESLIVLELLA